jgi:HEAT repeat protein
MKAKYNSVATGAGRTTEARRHRGREERLERLLAAMLVGILALSTIAQAAPDAASLVAQITERDKDGKHTAPAPEATAKLCEELLAAGGQGVTQLISLLQEPGGSEDYKARYLLHALSLHVIREKRDTQRKVAIEALIGGLKPAGPNVRSYLLQELQFLQAKEAVPALGELLLDEAQCDPAARALVVIATGAEKPLLQALPKVKARCRLTVIQALGDLRSKAAVGKLLPLLKDSAAEVRLSAGVALAKIADKRAATPMFETLKSFEGHDRVEMTDACFALAENLVAGGDREPAFAIYRGIWQGIGDAPLPHVRSAVVEGLAGGLANEKTAALVAKMKSDDPATRAACLHVFGRRGEAAAFDAVAAAMKDTDAGVRLTAAKVLPRVGGAKSVSHIVAAMPGDSPRLAQILRASLVSLEGEAADDALADALGSIPAGEKAIAVRLELLSVLTQRKSTRVADAVFPLAVSGDPAVRIGALKTLAVIGDGSYAAKLVERLGAVEDQDEMRALEDALLETVRRVSGGKQQVEVLSGGIGTKPAKLQCVLLRTVGRLGSRESIPVLETALKSDTAEVRDEAMRGLSQFPNDKPADRLLEIAKTSKDLKHQVLALRGYVRMAEENRKEDQRLAMLAEALAAAKRPDEIKLALGTMGKTRSPAAMKLVLGYLDDPKLADEAGLAAIAIGDRIRKSHKEVVRDAMTEVIAAIKEKRVQKRAEDLLKKVK